MTDHLSSLDQVARRPVAWGDLLTALFALAGIAGAAVLVAVNCATSIAALVGVH